MQTLCCMGKLQLVPLMHCVARSRYPVLLNSKLNKKSQNIKLGHRTTCLSVASFKLNVHSLACLWSSKSALNDSDLREP